MNDRAKEIIQQCERIATQEVAREKEKYGDHLDISKYPILSGALRAKVVMLCDEIDALQVNQRQLRDYEAALDAIANDPEHRQIEQMEVLALNTLERWDK